MTQAKREALPLCKGITTMRIKKTIAGMLLVACAVFGQNYKPLNSLVVWEDSARIDSTETKNFTAIWSDNGAQKTLLVESRDDSAVGFSSDSASYRIKLFQLFPVARGGINSYFVKLNSKADPDSTYPGTSYQLWDSLDIKSMDTSAAWTRNTVWEKNGSGANQRRTWGDSLTAAGTGFGAFAYSTLIPDYSPAIQLQVTGLKRNKNTGVGSMIKLRIYQLTETK